MRGRYWLSEIAAVVFDLFSCTSSVFFSNPICRQVIAWPVVWP